MPLFSPAADLLLIHPPSIFDFRKRDILFGPISDVVPSTPAFEMYPIGFSSIAEVLSQHEIGVRIVNLAYLMITRPKMDVRSYLKSLKARAFGISLHWLPHAHGATELARLLKEVHPDVPIIFGGYSSTYFAREIIQYPFVDYVVTGDSTERALVALMEAIKGRGDLKNVPNLVYKDKDKIVVNEQRIVEGDLNSFINNYRNLFRKALKYRDISGMTPIYDWWRYPITMIVTCRGCSNNCAICGGSKWAGKRYLNRDSVAYREPERVAQDLIGLSRFTHAPIFMVGDIRQGGDEYADRFIAAVAGARIQNPIVLELFNAAPEGYFEAIGRALPNVNFEISPETHDDRLRALSGKTYSREGMEDNIRWALKYGAKKFDVFFMIGIPGQDSESVMDTVRYGGDLMREFGHRLMPFISPLAPFLDPGSIAFENPQKFGYKVRMHTFREHVEALNGSSWVDMLNYDSDSLSRHELATSTYEAGSLLNELKRDQSQIGEGVYRRVRERVNKDIVRITEKPGDRKKNDRKAGKSGGIDTKDLGIVCDKDEIKWSSSGKGFRYINIGIAVASDVIKRLGLKWSR
jgi:B12-binding domain/radical SAM domain protein